MHRGWRVRNSGFEKFSSRTVLEHPKVLLCPYLLQSHVEQYAYVIMQKRIAARNIFGVKSPIKLPDSGTKLSFFGFSRFEILKYLSLATLWLTMIFSVLPRVTNLSGPKSSHSRALVLF